LYLVEKHAINKSNVNFKRIDELCFLSKNLYNFALYTIKKEFESTGKWIRYNDLDKLMQSNENYKLLPAAGSQQILMVLDKNLKGYFALLRMWKKDKTKLRGCPKFPKFKDKIKGRNLLIFTDNQFKYIENIIVFPKKAKLAPLTTKQTNVKQVRIVPRLDNYVIEVIYKKDAKILTFTEKWSSIDLGLNNLATVACERPFIINGKPLKSINQYYNKKFAEMQSKLKHNYGKNSSNKLRKLTQKRTNKINDYLHKASRNVVDTLVQQNVTNLVIGLNKEWKQSINLGSKTNQKFVQIPHARFIDMIKYKSELEGICVFVREESYTSKCSALDLETIEKHETYLGKRTCRGMFVSVKGRKINADLNGALNILRKETINKGLEMVQTLSGRGQVVWPLKINL
jgi:putative transposase